MGTIKPTVVKRSGHELVAKYPGVFTTDFDTNKKLVDQRAKIYGKNLRNRIAGYVTRLVRQQQEEE